MYLFGIECIYITQTCGALVVFTYTGTTRSQRIIFFLLDRPKLWAPTKIKTTNKQHTGEKPNYNSRRPKQNTRKLKALHGASISPKDTDRGQPGSKKPETHLPLKNSPVRLGNGKTGQQGSRPGLAWKAGQHLGPHLR